MQLKLDGARALLRALCAEACRNERVYRHSWQVGDVVIWDGDPLEMTSAPVAVWIDGVAQPMTDRQTRLRDRYATPDEGSLPKAYEW